MPEEPLRYNSGLKWGTPGLKWNGTISTTNNNTHNMSETNKISIEIPAADKTAILAKLDEIIVLILKFAIELSTDEREDTHTIGVKRAAMVATFDTQMAQNLTLVPGYIDIAEKGKDSASWSDVAEMIAKVNTVASLLGDTHHVIGSDLLTAYEGFYGYAKDAANRGIAGASAVVEALRPFFPQGRKAKKPVTPPTP